jgi:transcriptional regulator with XRE-family HTH domain
MSETHSLGEVLRARRKSFGISQGEVSRRAAIGYDVVSRIESGFIRQPDPRKLARLADVLDFPLSTLYNLAGYPTGRDLPSFQPYLRSRYGQLPAEAVDKLAEYFEEVRSEYGLPPDGPSPGEDETPE